MVVDMLSTHYREEGRRVKARIDRRNYSNWELTVRYYFKVPWGNVRSAPLTSPMTSSRVISMDET